MMDFTNQANIAGIAAVTLIAVATLAKMHGCGPELIARTEAAVAELFESGIDSSVPHTVLAGIAEAVSLLRAVIEAPRAK